MGLITIQFSVPEISLMYNQINSKAGTTTKEQVCCLIIQLVLPNETCVFLFMTFGLGQWEQSSWKGQPCRKGCDVEARQSSLLTVLV